MASRNVKLDIPIGTTPTSPTPIDTLGNPVLSLVLNVTAIGATPTITAVLEQSPDGTNWAAFNPAVTKTLTAVGSDFVSASQSARYIRIRVTANTNVTATAYVTASGGKKAGGGTGMWGTDDWPEETGSYYGINGNGQITGTGLVSSEGLQLAYDMETLAAGKMKDFSPNGRDGTITEAVDAAGKFGRARTFDGINDVITASAITPPGVDMTLAGWFKWTALPTFNAGMSGATYSWETGTDNNGKAYCLFYQQVGPDISVATTSPLAYNDGNWHHIAAVLRGGQASVYVDGARKSGPTTGTPLTSVRPSGGSKIGFTASGGGFLNGTIDEILIFNKALSDIEIQALANRRRS